jgi:hypothetical protein
MPNEFNYGDYFGQDWTTHQKYEVTFSGSIRGVILLEASDEASAEHDAKDFQRRFNLFPIYGKGQFKCSTRKLERTRE